METKPVITNVVNKNMDIQIHPDGFKRRLEIFRKSLNVSQEAFALNVGLSTVSYKQIKDNPTLQMILRFTRKYPDLSYEWLLEGEGDMLKEKAVISNINNNIHSQNAHNINNGSGNINETQASSSEIIELLKQQNATLTQQVASLTELVKNITTK